MHGEISGADRVFAAYFLRLSFPLWLYLPLIFVLPMPAMVDWFTQSCKLRESKNSLRVGTGFLLGIIEGLLLLLLINGVIYMFLVGITIIGVYAFSMYIIALKTGCLDSYMEDIKRGR